eukprot:3147158-Rhodomonas_salina.3
MRGHEGGQPGLGRSRGRPRYKVTWSRARHEGGHAGSTGAHDGVVEAVLCGKLRQHVSCSDSTLGAPAALLFTEHNAPQLFPEDEMQPGLRPAALALLCSSALLLGVENLLSRYTCRQR